MNSKDIKQKLNELGYENVIISITNNGIKLRIVGNVYVQEIKDNFNVVKWEYSGNAVEFVLGE